MLTNIPIKSINLCYLGHSGIPLHFENEKERKQIKATPGLQSYPWPTKPHMEHKCQNMGI